MIHLHATPIPADTGYGRYQIWTSDRHIASATTLDEILTLVTPDAAYWLIDCRRELYTLLDEDGKPSTWKPMGWGRRA